MIALFMNGFSPSEKRTCRGYGPGARFASAENSSSRGGSKMRKRIISLLLALCMLASVLPMNVLAAQADAKRESASVTNPFTDVKSTDWFYSAVLYAVANGFFNGTSKTAFTPDGTMTRGMFVTVLGRMAGVKPESYGGDPDFTDVSADAYYAPYVKWAAKYGIASGTGDGKFSPEDFVTREQMAVFFVRYFEAMGVSYATGANIQTAPADLERVSFYAQDAVMKLWREGLLGGDGKNFDPEGNASRCQAAALCMRTDKAVDTWYSEPGVPSDRVRVDPAEDLEPSETPSSGSADIPATAPVNPNVYYKVTAALGTGMDAAGVTLPEAKLYPMGTKLSAIPTPYQQGRVFLGWYYDEAMTDPALSKDTVVRNVTLYAKMGDVTPVPQQETPNYVTVEVKSGAVAGYSFRITGYAEGCISSFINVTAGNEAMSYSVSGGTVTAAFAPGQTYRVELAEDSPAVFYVNSSEQPASVRILNIITEKQPVDNLKLDGGVKYIPKADVTDPSADLDGLFTVSLTKDAAGETSIQQVERTGVFTYSGPALSVGDLVAIYTGERPDRRSLATLGTDGDGAIAYVEITAADGSSYGYKTADSQDVLFTPDVLPIPADADTDGDSTNHSITVSREVLDFSGDEYAAMGLDSLTTADAGDYLAFYTGSFGAASASAGYGKIVSVTGSADGESCTIVYEDATKDQVMAAMDLYSTQNEEITLTDEERKAIEDDLVRQAQESGFVNEAARYLTALALETDGFQTLRNDLGMEPVSFSAAYADGTPVSGSSTARYDSAKITDKTVSATVAAGKVLQHFEGSYGIRVELSISFTVAVGSRVEIKVQAVFEQEVLLTLNTSGGAIWKWAWIFPYIYDYRLNANIDLGTYTGIGITALASTKGEDDDDFSWDDITGDGAAGKLVNIGKQITELMEQKERFLGEKMVDENGEEVEWAGTNGGGLADKYSAMMENAEESWVEIFRQEIFSQEGNVDPLHILCYGVNADFVVSANLYVTLGLTFSYSVAKRYNFSLQLFHKSCTNETIDLEESNYNFDFYVMGTMGIRAGVEFEIAVGLFSLKLDSIGICAEAGAYAQMWGYFYFHKSWSQSGGTDSNCAGALLVEVGLYLSVSFKAQLFSCEKLTYQPTLYDNQWPLLTVGAAENIYDFAYERDDDDLVSYELQGVRSVTLPTAVFEMNYMDMKSGEQFGSDADDPNENPAANFDDDTESRFTITLSNPKFRYDAAANTVSVEPGTTSVAEDCEMTITWKNGSLAFTSRPIQRVISIQWTDPANLRFIAFDSQGGSRVKMLAFAAGTALTLPQAPEKAGYSFAGWYTNAACTTPFTLPAAMPDYPDSGKGKGITVYAKWTPRNDTKYTAQHYLQNLDGTYTLADTVVYSNGLTEGLTNAKANSYEHYTLRPFNQQRVAPNGSTVVKIYYTRINYSISFTYGDLADGNAPLVYRGKYGQVLYVPALTLGGYDFLGYAGLTGDTITVTGSASYSAVWSARDDTPYRVEHYIQRSDGEGYILPSGDGSIESFTGTTGSLITINDKVRASEGLTYRYATVGGQQVTAPVIGADGKTIVKLYYDRSSCTLTFNSMGGSAASSITKRFGAKLTLPTPNKTGYTFDGWYTDETCTTPFAGATMPAESLTLYAKWAPREDTPYKVEHYLQNADDDGYTLTDTDELTGKTAATVTASAGSFDHFTLNESAQGTVKEGAITPDGKLVLRLYYDRETFALTFMDGETELESRQVRHGAAITAPTPEKAGYDLGWTPAVPDVMPAADSTYTTVWTARGDTPYKVEHYLQNADDGSYTLADTDSLTGKTDDSVTAAAKTAYAHYAVNPDAAGAVPTGTIRADGSLVLRLYYDLETVTISFDPNGGTLPVSLSGGTKDFRYGQAFSADAAEQADYGFAGWYNGETAFAAGTAVTEALTLTAHWTAGEVSYTVEHYVMNPDGSYAAAITDPRSGLVDSTLTLAELKNAGYEVEGGIAYHHAVVAGETAETVSITGGMTVKLYYDRIAHNLSWDFADGEYTGSYTSGSVLYGAPITAPVPTLLGYILSGWDSTVPAAMPAGDLSFTAQWKPGEYTITFNTAGGAALAPITLKYLEAVPDGIVAAREGCTFLGWEPELPEVMPAENLTVTALWEVRQFTMTFVSDGGLTFDPITQDYGTAVTAPAVPTRPGYDFMGWYLGDAPYTFTTMPAESLTLTAKWQAQAFTISFDSMGGSDVAAISAPYGAAITAPDAPTWPGHTFTGWYLGDEVYTFTTMPAENLTLTAHWTLAEFTIVYDGAGTSYTLPDGAPTSFTAETETFDLPVLTLSKTKQIFGGWYTSSNFAAATKVTSIEQGTIPADGSTLTLYAKWTIPSVTIETAEDLVAFQQAFNRKELAQNTIVYITAGATLDLPANWQPIGVSGYNYQGRFHATVSDFVTININGNEPLFYNIGSSAVVERLNLFLRTQVILGKGDYYGVLARKNYGEVFQCKVLGNPDSDDYDIISPVDGTTTVGGLVGINYGHLDMVGAGWYEGYKEKDAYGHDAHYKLTIRNYATKGVTGGIAGSNDIYSSNWGSSIDLINQGYICVDLDVQNASAAGGVVGLNVSNPSKNLICIVYGYHATVFVSITDGTDSEYIGGAVGKCYGSINNTWSTGYDTLTILGHINTKANYVGGIAGWAGNNGSFIGSVRFGARDNANLYQEDIECLYIKGKQYVGGLFGCTSPSFAATFKSLAIYPYTELNVQGESYVGGFVGQRGKGDFDCDVYNDADHLYKLTGAADSTHSVFGDSAETDSGFWWQRAKHFYINGTALNAD